MKWNTLKEWSGDNGIPSRIGTVELDGEPNQVMRLLRERGGCCAWQGRTACNAEPTHLAVGGVFLVFVTYRAVYQPNEPAYALLCDRHMRDVRRDMPQKVEKSAQREYFKLLDMMGTDDDPAFVAIPLDEVA